MELGEKIILLVLGLALIAGGMYAIEFSLRNEIFFKERKWKDWVHASIIAYLLFVGYYVAKERGAKIVMVIVGILSCFLGFKFLSLIK